FAEQQAIGYPSALIEGERDCRGYLLDMFDDWQAPGITAVLHEKKGGYANNVRSLEGLAAKAAAQGVRVVPGVRVTGVGTARAAGTGGETDPGGGRGAQRVIPGRPPGRRPWGA